MGVAFNTPLTKRRIPLVQWRTAADPKCRSSCASFWLKFNPTNGPMRLNLASATLHIG